MIYFFFNNKIKFLYLIQVKLWTTFNEPRLVAFAYGNEGMAPSVGETFNGIAEYTVIRNILLAHAKAYRLYKKDYAESQKGKQKYLFRGDALRFVVVTHYLIDIFQKIFVPTTTVPTYVVTSYSL